MDSSSPTEPNRRENLRLNLDDLLTDIATDLERLLPGGHNYRTEVSDDFHQSGVMTLIFDDKKITFVLSTNDGDHITVTVTHGEELIDTYPAEILEPVVSSLYVSLRERLQAMLAATS